MNTINRLTRNTPYYDRNEAGEFLAQEILLHLGEGAASPLKVRRPTAFSPHSRRAPAVVIGLCRGGVPVARTVARILRVPFDFLVVRKLSSEVNPELAIGALAECGPLGAAYSNKNTGKEQEPARRVLPGTPRKQEQSQEASDSKLRPSPHPNIEENPGVVEVLNRDILAHLPDADATLASARDRETAELRRRVLLYRAGTAPKQIEGKRVILVDDGAATGATMMAAIASARKQGACEIIVALPVAPEEVCSELSHEADVVICPWTPTFFMSVGSHYTHFPQVEDEQICEALQKYA